jgi:hypothetical protein
VGDSNAVASSSNPVAPSNIEGEADGDTDADGSSNSPVKTQPREVDIADMLMVPEPETITPCPFQTRMCRWMLNPFLLCQTPMPLLPSYRIKMCN